MSDISLVRFNDEFGFLTFPRPDQTLQQTWSSRDLSLGLETSRDPFLQVLVSVLVLEPQSLGLGLGLGLGIL